MKITQDNSPRARKDRAHKMIRDAGTATYWMGRVKALLDGADVKGAWAAHPELVQEILDCEGKAPPGERS